MTTDIATVDQSTALTTPDPEQAAAALAHILATGDLSELSDQGRVAFYLEQCRTLGLNSISRPFDWIWFDEPGGGKRLTLYLNRSGTDQLRRQHQLSWHFTRKAVVGDLFCVEVEGMTPTGRVGQASKYVPLTNKFGKLKGRLLADAFARAETGALRRLTLAMVGLMSPAMDLDLETARPVIVDGTGRIIERPTDEQVALASDPKLATTINEPTYETTSSADQSPLVGVSQAVTADELERPTRPYKPPTSFRCDADQWRRTWFAVVKDSFLDTDDDRGDFVEWYTSGLPPQRQTRSLTTFLSTSTERQAEALVNAAREAIARDRAARAEHDAASDDAEYFLADDDATEE